MNKSVLLMAALSCCTSLLPADEQRKFEQLQSKLGPIAEAAKKNYGKEGTLTMTARGKSFYSDNPDVARLLRHCRISEREEGGPTFYSKECIKLIQEHYPNAVKIEDTQKTYSNIRGIPRE